MNSEQFCARYAVDRKNTGSVKWDGLKENFGDDNLLAMWVADMEFRAPDGVIEALRKRLDHGVFGYTSVPDSYFEAFSNWMQRRHGCHVERDWTRFSPGVVPALYWIVQAFTQPEDAVLIMSPVYGPFSGAVRDTGRTLVSSPLRSENGVYTMDWERLEQDMASQAVKLMIHCSPHNPVGRVWTLEETRRLMALCKRHGVLLASDEIHQDLIVGDRKQVPAITAAGEEYRDNLIVLNSFSKTFNLAALSTAHVLIPDPKLRERYDAFTKGLHLFDPNLMGVLAGEAAYREGEEWLDALLDVVRENYRYLRDRLLAALPKLVVSPLEGTYLMWIDFGAYVAPERMKEVIQDQCRLAVDFGDWFGEQSAGCIRLNLATPPENVRRAAESILEHLA